MTNQQSYYIGLIMGLIFGGIGSFMLMVYVALKADRKMQAEKRIRENEWRNN